jgi:DNA (cytosine-5)-methyltransferase 1
MNHAEKLTELYEIGIKMNEIEFDKVKKTLPTKIINNISAIAKNCLNQKGVYTVLVTLLIHKLIHPKQDIRYHQDQLTNGFSGRTIDTKYITPTLKKLGLPAMAESGWLTRTLEQPYPYTLDYDGKIRKSVKMPFLEIVDYIERSNELTIKNITTVLLKQVYNTKNQVESIKINPIINPENIKIDSIIDCLEKHFNFKYELRGASKLPVLSFYAIFSILISELKRYKTCHLNPLGSHTASDRTSKTAGDIEIFDSNNNLIEAIEIKHKRSIDISVILDIQQKIYKFNPYRYCIFSSGEVKYEEIKPYITEISNKHGCELIVNGILPTLKYYLRLISSRSEFLKRYSTLIEADKEINHCHKIKWKELIDILNAE